ncbi:MAG: 50S ribosomal protein L30 [Ignavibacteria bacterium GWB2_35_6b]|nr:MAG: 50S ribosomal protein L30 [Ignavibacteria bacterium GWB2_35_6b]
MAKKLKITQTRSTIDRPKDQKRTIEALGLGRPNYEVVHNDTPQIRGMIRKVSHLVKFEETEG